MWKKNKIQIKISTGKQEKFSRPFKKFTDILTWNPYILLNNFIREQTDEKIIIRITFSHQ